MFDKSLLTPGIKVLRDDFLFGVREKILYGESPHYAVGRSYIEFKEYFDYYVQNNKGFKLTNLDQFPHKEIIIGCHQYLEGLLIKYGQHNLQILEHDYTYYSRLRPHRTWSVPGKLIPNQPLVIATPFPAYVGLHPQFVDILGEAYEKNIPIHLDGAWCSCSKGIDVDVSHPSIASVGISLTKGYDASWNRIGLRYTKIKDETDPITIYDNANMCPQSTVMNGIAILENIPMDYMWNTYGEQYAKVIDYFDLEQGNILFGAYNKDKILCNLSEVLKL